MSKAAMELVRDALKEIFDPFDTEDMRGGNVFILPSQVVGGLKAIATLDEAIKQQGEPVLWVDPETGDTSYIKPLRPTYIPLYTSAPTIPEGWQLVPKQPTLDMLLAYTKCRTEAGERWAQHQWKAILSATPAYKGDHQ